jgi:hypothetical protein
VRFKHAFVYIFEAARHINDSFFALSDAIVGLSPSVRPRKYGAEPDTLHDPVRRRD